MRNFWRQVVVMNTFPAHTDLFDDKHGSFNTFIP